MCAIPSRSFGTKELTRRLFAKRPVCPRIPPGFLSPDSPSKTKAVQARTEIKNAQTGTRVPTFALPKIWEGRTWATQYKRAPLFG
jgi:hypothetical protein